MMHGFENILKRNTALLILSLVLLCGGAASGKVSNLRRSGVSSKTLRSMARIYIAYGKYEQAEPLIEQALTLVRKTETPNSEIAMCLIDASYLYKKQNKLAGAEQMCQLGLKLQQQSLYENHPYIAHTLRILSSIYRKQGKLLQAETALEKASTIMRKSHTEDDYAMVSLEMDMAKLLVARGDLAKAESHYRHVLSVINKRSPDHFYKASVLEDLAKLSLKQGKFGDAQLQIDQVLAMKAKVYGSEHHLLIPALFVRASIEREKGDYAASEKFIQRALTAVKTTASLTRIIEVQQRAEEIRTVKVLATNLIAKVVNRKTLMAVLD